MSLFQSPKVVKPENVPGNPWRFLVVDRPTRRALIIERALVALAIALTSFAGTIILFLAKVGASCVQ